MTENHLFNNIQIRSFPPFLPSSCGQCRTVFSPPSLFIVIGNRIARWYMWISETSIGSKVILWLSLVHMRIWMKVMTQSLSDDQKFPIVQHTIKTSVKKIRWILLYKWCGLCEWSWKWNSTKESWWFSSWWSCASIRWSSCRNESTNVSQEQEKQERQVYLDAHLRIARHDIDGCCIVLLANQIYQIFAIWQFTVRITIRIHNKFV